MGVRATRQIVGEAVPTEDEHTDLAELRRGHITLTPLDYDLTKTSMVNEMRDWKFDLGR